MWGAKGYETSGGGGGGGGDDDDDDDDDHTNESREGQTYERT